MCAVTLYVVTLCVVTLCVVTLWGSPCERSPCAWSPCTSVHAQWPQPVSDVSRGIRCPRVTVPRGRHCGLRVAHLEVRQATPYARSQVEPWTPCPDPHREAWVPRGPRLETAAVVPVTEGVAEGTPLGAGTHVQAESSCGALPRGLGVVFLRPHSLTVLLQGSPSRVAWEKRGDSRRPGPARTQRKGVPVDHKRGCSELLKNCGHEMC